VRYVKDYHYEFKTYTKRRWIGQNILDFFAKEFIAYTHEYYKDAITSGILQKPKNRLKFLKTLIQNSKTPK
jgi:hypothetical protein